jgi:hypothetical protein
MRILGWKAATAFDVLVPVALGAALVLSDPDLRQQLVTRAGLANPEPRLQIVRRCT